MNIILFKSGMKNDTLSQPFIALTQLNKILLLKDIFKLRLNVAESHARNLLWSLTFVTKLYQSFLNIL